ncbi:MAG: PEP-CTERM sorting domain-containing protein [Phycisphaeraceae bacterium]|nr:PEP-CTERM sorting domain-containing protein [Phycisphaeraceae bacterium]
MSKHVLLVAAMAALVLSLGISGSARADDALIVTDFAGLGPSVVQQFEHMDGEPFKGYVTVNLTNTGSAAWGDFHFEIFGIPGFPSVANVSFVVDSPYEPTSSQSGLTWAVDNVVVGATLDLFFYSDPVLPGESASFMVYTDNADHVPFFGVAIYPTPIPEPATLALMGLGGLFISRRRR